jgi:hypothetical protein
MVSFVKEFEDYVLNDRNDDSLKTLIPGLEHDYYIKITKAINQINEETSEETMKSILDLITDSHNKTGYYFANLKIIAVLREYDIKSTSEERKKAIIKEIQNELSLIPSTNFIKQEIKQVKAKKEIKLQNNMADKFSSGNNSESQGIAFDTSDKKISKLDPSKYDIEKLTKDYLKDYKTKLNNKEHLFFTEYINLEEQDDEFMKFLLINNSMKINYWKLSDAEIVKIAEFINKYLDKQKASPNFDSFMNSLTIPQLEVLQKNLKSTYFDYSKLFNILLKSLFDSELKEAQNSAEKEVEVLKKIFLFAKDNNKKEIVEEVRLKLLEIQAKKLFYFDYELFIEHIKNPRSYDYTVNKLQDIQVKQVESKVRINVCDFNFVQKHQEKELYELYLHHFFFNENKKPEEFDSFLNEKFVMKIYHIAQAYKGEETQSTIDYLSKAGVYVGIVKDVKLNICDHNKKLFSSTDDVFLDLDIKNISTLFLNIYEINTENYYRSQKKAIPSDLPVEGLMATYDQTFVYNEPPQKIVRRRFTLDKISKKRGVYIVEFIGGGRSSRALIKIGSLSVMSREGGYGRMFFLLNEHCETLKKLDVKSSTKTETENETDTKDKDNNINSKEISSSNNNNRRGIWFLDTFYSALLDDGVIIIPYMRNAVSDVGILVDGDFSEIISISIPKETYQLRGDFHFCHESLIMGNSMKVIFKPQLFVNNRIIPLVRLKKPKITVTLGKMENNSLIPIKHVFEDIKLSDHSEVTFELQVPPKLINIAFNFECEIANKSLNVNEPLIVSTTHAVKTYSEDSNLFKLYLTKDGEEYLIQALGKNGEPKRALQLDILPKHKLSLFNLDKVSLHTDDQGFVYLGNINYYCSGLTVTGTYQNKAFSENFNFDLENDFYNYPTQLDLLENEEVSLPLRRGQGTERHSLDYYIALLSISTGKILRDLTLNSNYLEYNAFKLSSEKENPDNNSTSNSGELRLKNLPVGEYRVFFREINQSIAVKVHKGKPKGLNFLQLENEVIENSQYRNPLRIESAELITKEGKTSGLHIKLNKNHANARVHVFAYHYFNNSTNAALSIKVNCTYKSATMHSKSQFNTWKNIFMSNKILADEIQYVLDRKHQERYLGNSLDKPSLIMKRKFVRDTTTDEENLNSGTNFDRIENNIVKCAEMNDFFEMDCQQSSNNNFNYQQQQQMPLQHQQQLLGDAFGFSGSNYNSSPTGYSTFHNFLLTPPLVYTNIFPNENNEIELNDPALANYKVFELIAIDEKSSCQTILSPEFIVKSIKKVKEEREALNKETPSDNTNNNNNELVKAVWPLTKDLTLKHPLDKTKYFSEVRNNKVYYSEETINISDIASVAFKLIDGIDKFIAYQSAINPSITNEWDKLRFLTKLNELPEEELLEKIEKNFSHEFNVFLYFRYPELFKNYILPVLKFKVDKTFIDLFLLGDLNSIEKLFEVPSFISSLNLVEKVLLLKFMSENAKNDNDLEKCAYISQYITEKAEKIAPKGEEKKRLFNILMNMKTDDQALGGVNNNAIPPNMALFSRSIPTSAHMNSFNRVQLQMNSRCAESMNYQRRHSGAQECKKEQVRMDKFCEEENYCDDDYEDEFCEEARYNDDCFGDLVQSQNKQKLRQDPGKSQEYVETQYLYTNGYSNNTLNINLSMFWADACQFYSTKNKNNQFLTTNVLSHFSSVSELIFAIAFLDLPFKSANHEYCQNENRSLSIKLNNNCILFTKEISETHSSDKDITLMIAQNTCEVGKPDSEETIEEYLINKVYSHKTIVTNITNEKIDFELLIQIPQGAIPIMNSDYIKTINDSLDKFFTRSYEVFFYFPQCGGFSQTGPNVCVEGVVVAKGEELTYNVVSCFKNLITTNIENILETGTKEDLLDFFSKSPIIKNEDVNKVLKFTNDFNFYSKLKELLEKQFVYHPELWKIGFMHNDEKAIKEVLNNSLDLKRRINGNFKSKLLTINDVNNYNINNHLDYDPVLNARVHKLGDNSILNTQLRETYQRFIMSMIELNDCSEKSKLRLTYYLILQDRIEEAVNIFKKVDFKQLVVYEEFLIQYDYIAAYLDISTGYPDFKIAKETCTRYKNFPLLHWREFFEEIEDQLIQYLGEEKVSDIDSIVNESRKAKLKASTVEKELPKLAFKIENTSLAIKYTNVEEIVIKLYLIDIEVIFSTKPFLKSEAGDFSFVKPNYIETIKLVKSCNEETLKYEINEEYTNKNLFIEVATQGIKNFDIFFSSSINVNFSRNLGEVKVVDQANNPLSRVYIKCFAQMKDGSTKFYKDGYTDLRGMFNYVSLNTNQIGKVSKFSILISDDKLGAVIKEAFPPENLKTESGVNEYQSYQNLRQEVKELWRSKNKMK